MKASHFFSISYFTFALISTQSRAESITVAAAPKTADIYMTAGGDDYLSIAYYDWGEAWSGVKRVVDSVDGAKEVKFSFKNTLQNTKANFNIDGTWKQVGKDSLRFEAKLVPEVSSPLVMSQFSLKTGGAFAKTEARVNSADGTSKQVPVPFPRGNLGDAVKSIELTDTKGKTTTVTFDAPTSISADGAARIILVKDKMEAGKTYGVAFTVKLPDEAKFLFGPASAGDSTVGWYPFTGASPIPPESEWSMANWLETPAGKHGRITSREEKLLYNGKPIKLWGLNLSYGACAPEKALADRRADFYAALGINAVRLHKYADGTGWAGIQTKESARQFDPKKLDDMDYFVAALKKRGIYTKLSPVFIIDVGPGDRDMVPYMDELGPMQGDRINPKHGSLYISPELQDLLIAQVENILNHTNPHTGMKYADDPAIAYVELYNEDSALFGGVSNVMANSKTLRQKAGKSFSDWLKKKYTTEEAFIAAWGKEALNCSILGNAKIPLDESWAEGRIYPAGNPWFFDPDNLNTSQAPFKRRLLDTMAYLYDTQNAVYARYAKAIRATGYKGELIASNWQAGRNMSHFYNLHSDALVGTIDRHNYFGGGGNFFFGSASMLAVPGGGSLSASMQQVSNKPFMLSEWIHVQPNEWGVEGPAILGAYGMGLQGWDVSFPFQNSDDGTFATAIGKQAWDVVAPNFLGIFPAVSRQVLRGDVKESDVAHTRNVHIPSLDEGNVGFDEKVVQQWDIKTFDSDVFPSKALAAAKGTVKFTDTFEPTKTFDMTPYIKANAIVSSTGQLNWVAGANDKDGYIEINTPGTQAIVGFAKGKTADLADAKISPTSRYGAIYLSAKSKDGSIAKDNAVLLSAISRARNVGTVVADDSFLFSRGEIKSHKPQGPVVMEPVTADITLKRGGNPTVHVLDQRGVKTGKTVPVVNGVFKMDTGRDATPYYLITW